MRGGQLCIARWKEIPGIVSVIPVRGANRTRGFLLDHSFAPSLPVPWRGYLYRLSIPGEPLQTVRDLKPVHESSLTILRNLY